MDDKYIFDKSKTTSKTYPNLQIIPQTKNPTNVGLDIAVTFYLLRDSKKSFFLLSDQSLTD